MEQLSILSPEYSTYRTNLLKNLEGLYRSVDSTPYPGLTPFKSSWRIDSTLADLCSDIVNDYSVNPGDAFLGEVSCSGLPEGLSRCKLRIEVSKGITQKLLTLNAISSSLAPYYRQQTYYGGSFSGWKSWVVEENSNSSSAALFYQDVYLGVAENYTDIIDPNYYHSSIERGVTVSFTSVDGYVWVLAPENCRPSVAMSLIQIPIREDTTVSVSGRTYKVWRSYETHSGTFKLCFF